DDVKRYVSHNVMALEEELRRYLSSPTEILAINDVSIFLHGRRAEDIMNYIRLAKTFLGSCYYGLRLVEDYGSGLSRWEKMQVEKLMEWMDNRIHLS
ncbi:MAG: hypothetical protein QXX57_05930, partial [Nitrososphaerota archaeon]